MAMPMLSPELDLTAALTSQFSEQFLWATVREVREIRCSIAALVRLQWQIYEGF